MVAETAAVSAGVWQVLGRLRPVGSARYQAPAAIVCPDWPRAPCAATDRPARHHRRCALDRDEGMVIGRISPKYVEAIPARIGLQFDRRTTFDPALRRHCVMQQVGRVDKVNLAIAFQEPLFSV